MLAKRNEEIERFSAPVWEQMAYLYEEINRWFRRCELVAGSISGLPARRYKRPRISALNFVREVQ
jgi:hypothetical protein